jgi:hypothetical protein
MNGNIKTDKFLKGVLLFLHFTKEKEVFMTITDMTWAPSVTF